LRASLEAVHGEVCRFLRASLQILPAQSRTILRVSGKCVLWGTTFLCASLEIARAQGRPFSVNPWKL
jgi:hypothetical protein